MTAADLQAQLADAQATVTEAILRMAQRADAARQWRIAKAERWADGCRLTREETTDE